MIKEQIKETVNSSVGKYLDENGIDISGIDFDFEI